MKDKEVLINVLLYEKKMLEDQISDLPFKGYPEIKERNDKKYIYLRYKKYGRLSSTYAGIYNEQLYKELKDISNTIRELNYKLRSCKTKLAKLGVTIDELSPKTLLNMDYIRCNINSIIYGQAMVEGISVTFLDTKEILDKGSCVNVSFDDTLKVLNLKNAWQYILDENTIRRGISFYVLCNIAGFINDRLISYPSELRSYNAYISGSTYKPPLPVKEDVINNIDAIINNEDTIINKAIDLLCYISKAQIFGDGNKRIAVIFANLYLLIQGYGFIAIPPKYDNTYKDYLVDYYESKNEKIKKFLLEKCFNKLD